MAPTTAPTQVFATLITFSGVYTAAYKPMLAAPKAAAVPFACIMPQATLQEGSSWKAGSAAVKIDRRVAAMLYQGAQTSNLPLTVLERRDTLRQRREMVYLRGKYVDPSTACEACKEQSVASGQAPGGQGSPFSALHPGVVCNLIHLIQRICRCGACKGAQGRPP